MKKLYKNSLQWCLTLKKMGMMVLTFFGAIQGLEAQVSGYTFTQNTGTFNSIASSGTLVAGSSATTVAPNDTAGWSVTIPFNFKFNNTDFTSIYVNSNGGATFGTTTSNGASLISTTTAYTGAIGVMNRDLWGAFVTSGVTTSGSNIITNVASFKGIEIGKQLNSASGIPTGTTVTAFDETAGTITMSAAATSSSSTAAVQYGTGKIFTSTEGTAPNRVFVVEWIGYNDYSTGVTGSNYLNFQLRLAETSNTISIVYGPYYNINTTARTNQIGLRGTSASDFNNRSGAAGNSWNSTSAGTTNTASVSRDNVNFPASGQTYTWTPPTCFAPTGLTVATATITANGATASWTAASSVPANGYEIYYSTSNTAPTSSTVLDASNSTTSTTTSAPINGLSPSTTYYVWVRSVCGSADKSVWIGSASFTTLATCFVPTALSVASGTITANGATASWTAPSNVPANGYEVYYSTSNTAPTSSTVLNSTNSTTSSTTSAPINGLSPSTTYYVWVRSVCIGTDRSVWTSSVSFTTLPTCFVPTALTVASGTITQTGATASWTAPSNAPANGYEVYYSTSSTAPTSGTVLNTSNSTTSSTTSAPINGLSPSTTYYVWVRSVCIGTDRSVWTSVTSFATLCQPPALLTVTGSSFCPGNTANLTATADAGAAVNWYDVSTGGAPLATGNTFTTPALSNTTTYYASAINSSNASVGPVSPTAQGGTTGTQTVAWGVYYTTTTTAKLKSVDIFPITSGQTGSIKIVSGSQSVGTGTALATIPFTTNVSGGATAQTITIDVELPAGSYTIYPTLPTGGLSRNISGATYPYTSSIANITGNGYDPTYYMCFYNFKFTSGCESARQPVVATADSSVCLGTSEVNANERGIKVYPNPFTDILNISDISKVKSVSVIDVAGRLVKTIEKPNSALYLGELKSGMYVVVLNMADGSQQTMKAIKK